MRWTACLMILIIVSPAIGQELVDYGLAAHWTGGVMLASDLRSPILVGDRVLVVDGTRTLRRVDISDPYAPAILSSVSFTEPVERVFGPFGGHVYAAGAEHLFVLDAATCQQIAALDHRNVTDVTFGETFGALLAEGGDDLVTFDVGRPDSLPVYSAAPLGGGHQSMSCVSIGGSRIFVSRNMSFTAVGLFDAGDPVHPEHVANFGWAYQWWKQSTESQHVSIRAFEQDDPYTIEYYHFFDTGTGIDRYRSHVTRWNLADPTHPEVAARWSPTPDHLGIASPFHALVGDELLTLYFNRVMAVDLSAPDLDRAFIKVGFEWKNRPSGLASADGIIVVGQTDGTLNVFRDRRPDGPEPVQLADLGITSASFGENRYMMVTRWMDDLYQWNSWIRVLDISDPNNPVQVLDRRFGNPTSMWCAVAPHCAVTTGAGLAGLPRLDSYDLETGSLAVHQGNARDFEFLDAVYGVATGDDGLHVYDTSTPTSFVAVAHPWDQQLIQVALSTGDDAAAPSVATLDTTGAVGFWNVEDPRDPQPLATLDADFDGLVDLTGGPDRIVAGIRHGRDDWRGFTLVLVDCADPLAPTIAGSLRVPARPYGGALVNDTLHLACDGAGLVVVDIGDLQAPRIRGGFATDIVHDVRLHGDHLLLAGLELQTLPLVVETPIIQIVTGLDVVQHDRWIDVRWSLAPGAERPEFRLHARTDSGVRQIGIREDDGTWSGRDEEPFWGETTYVLEHRLSAESEWTVTVEQAMTLVAPARARILEPAPNPFNPQVSLVIDTIGEERVTLRIYDIAGRTVRTIVDGHRPPGRHQLAWDGRDQHGRELPSGTYVAELVAGATRDSRKLQLVR